MLPSSRLLLLPIMLLGATIASAAPAPKEDASSLLFPGGIADPVANIAFVTNTAGGIDAIDLNKGELLWDTKDAARPLAVVGKKLAVQVPIAGKANEVRIFLLDSAAKG